MKTCPHCGHQGNEKSCPKDGTELVDPLPARSPGLPAQFLGQVFDKRYAIESLIGKGGMGWLFKARHLTLEHWVALKVLREDALADPSTAKRFHQEARACSQLTHPHTIKVHDFGAAENGYLYIAMELLQGEPLDRVIKHEGALAPERAVQIARQVCQSLDEAHEKGIVHRDLKPANIFLCEMHRLRDWVKVLDFGIAKFMSGGDSREKLTRVGQIFGTPRYMSPEQVQSLPLDHRTDLYSLGVILYELLAGQRPFMGPSLVELLAQHIEQFPPELPDKVNGRDIPASLVQLVAQLLSKSPDARPASAAEVETRLAAIETDLMVTQDNAQKATNLSPRSQRLAETKADKPPAADPPANHRRRPWLFAAAAMVALATIVALWSTGAPKEQPGQPVAAFVPRSAGTDDATTSPDDALARPPLPVESDVWPAAKTDSGPRPTDVAKALAEVSVREHAVADIDPPSADVADRVESKPDAAESRRFVTVMVHSAPVGAAISEDGRLLGHTPLELSVTEAVPRRIRLRLHGYRSEIRTVRAADFPALQIRLEKETGLAKMTEHHSAAPALPKHADTPAKGYRVPYPALPPQSPTPTGPGQRTPIRKKDE